jgi:hypothetical protein
VVLKTQLLEDKLETVHVHSCLCAGGRQFGWICEPAAIRVGFDLADDQASRTIVVADYKCI